MHRRSIQEIVGSLVASSSCKVALVASRFNEVIVKQLVEGAIDTLLQHGIAPENVTLTWVPGAFEIPVVAKRWAESGQVDAIICLGAVIRGATPHFEYVAGQVAAGISRIGLESSIPVTFGVLTTDSVEQAIERAGCKAGNKGSEAAIATLETVDVLRKLPAAETLANHTSLTQIATQTSSKTCRDTPGTTEVTPARVQPLPRSSGK